MHVYPATLLGAALWLTVCLCWPGPWMVLAAPLAVSSVVLAAAIFGR